MSPVFRRRERPSSGSALRTRIPARSLPVAVLGTALVAAALVPGASPASAAKQRAKPAKVTIAKVTVKGAKVTVTGKVTLPSTLESTARNRKKVRVALTLTGAGGRKQAFTAPITSKLTFSASRTAKASGSLRLSAQVKVGGRASGKKAVKAVRVKPPAGSAPSGAGDGSTGPSIGGQAPAATGGGTTPGPVGAGPTTDPTDPGTPLVGLFRFDPGVSHIDGSVSGTWFRMGSPDSSPDLSTDGHWILNNSSTARDKTYTLLTPGPDGGLKTGVYQLPANPLYDGSGVLTQNIVKRTGFYGPYFTVFTATESGDYGGQGNAPVLQPVPPPLFYAHADGSLTGQTTAWVANWNGGSLFNQGSPKPAGDYPGFTKPVRGSYDPVTRRFVVQWTSLIQGRGSGFDGFGGLWHLEGTFEPAS